MEGEAGGTRGLKKRIARKKIERGGKRGGMREELGALGVNKIEVPKSFLGCGEVKR